MTIKTLSNRPICLVGIVTGIHSLVYGLGYIFGAGGFKQTVLYPNVAELMEPHLFGIILTLVALFVIVGFAQENEYLVNYSSVIQSVVWLFVSLVYFLSGAYLLGIGVGLVWTFLSGFASYTYRHRGPWIDRLIRDRLEE